MAQAINFNTPVRYLKGVGPKMAQKLSALEIHTVKDLLYYYPSRYEDYSTKIKISQLKPGETVTIAGEVVEFKNQYLKSGKTMQKALVKDDSGLVNLTWFNQPFLARIITVKEKAFFSGKVQKFANRLTLVSPTYELKSLGAKSKYSYLNTGRLVPVYPENKNIKSKYFRKIISQSLVQTKTNIQEFLPNSLLIRNKLINQKEAVDKIHFPPTIYDLKKAKQRLSYDEMFFIQLNFLLIKQSREKNKGQPLKPFHKMKRLFIKNLPFKLTNSQEKTIKEIVSDLGRTIPMNRLLQGDVGSGKTIVAATASYITALNGYQTIILVPTEILAFQHFKTFKNLFKPYKIKVALLTGKKKTVKKEHLGKYQIFIGTHALLNKKQQFGKLALTVVDEQHRFGVGQRKEIAKKRGSTFPHLLTMTATPIPRTVALTLHGDLSLSLLNQLPLGRKKVATYVVPPRKRQKGYQWIEKQIKDNRSQAFIICPFIEPSETKETIKAVKNEYSRLKKEVFPDLSLGIMHGRMKSEEKHKVLENMRKRKIDILVSTPVVEVGIDIPKATIMMIETADRFGLAQLHQLRGRVGRNKKKSYCFLFLENEKNRENKRLKAMETIHDGIKLAKIDLEVRGPGEVYGTKQHGFSKLKIASILDSKLIKITRKDALSLMNKDPKLKKYPRLKILSFNRTNPNSTNN
jgi:ATP-dependent DNA helicase RecG